MTAVAFPGQGGGLPREEWSLASVLKKGGYATFFAGKWHLGEADDAMPIAHGFDVMKNIDTVPPERLHLRRPEVVNPDMARTPRAKCRAGDVKGALSDTGEAGKG